MFIEAPLTDAPPFHRSASDIRTAASWQAVRGGLQPWQCRKVEAFILANLESPISIVQLATLARLCKSQFTRSFKLSFGMTPHRFVMRRRVTNAREMMLTSRAPLSHIAAACGLTDQAHLSNLFRKAFGVSPNQWRRWAVN